MARTRKPERAAPTLPASILDTLSTNDVAKLLDVTPDTVRIWIVTGRLEHFNVGSERSPRYRIPRAAAEALFQRPGAT